MLNSAQIKAALPPSDGRKSYKLYDGNGLYLEVTATSKRWRFKYTFRYKENRLSLGLFPDVSLKDARDKAREARLLLLEGVDPSAERKARKAEVKAQSTETVEIIGREWFEKFKHQWTAEHAVTVIYRLETNVFALIGTRAIKDIEPAELLACLRRIEARGHLELARRTKQICGQVWRYAVATGRAQRDITADLRGAIAPPVPRNFPTIVDPARLGKLLRDMDDYPGFFITRQAMRLSPIVFLRPGNLRQAEWADIDLENAVWRIGGEKMKGQKNRKRPDHITPLPRQAVQILKETHALSGRSRYVFPARGNSGGPMSENTVRSALRRLGYSNEDIVPHGFRHMASTILNEQGWSSDAIERQLAHVEQNKVRAAYNKAEFLEERRRMMQAWADYLESLKTSELR